MKEFSEGDLVWAWVGRGEPISGVVVRTGLATPWGTTDRLEVLIGDQLRELDGPRVWATREEAVRNPPMVLPSTGRIYPSMIARQMVQVQPMSQPTGLLFYLDHLARDEAPAGEGDDGEE
jgi:hypothetical protein